MFRIDNTTSVSSLPVVPAAGVPGYFTKGNPALAVAATIVEDWWLNTVQEEILAVVVNSGITPNKQDHTQLWQALQYQFQLHAPGPPPDLSGYLPLTGGTLHAPSASDLLRVYVDAGFYARVVYQSGIAGTWACGCDPSGNWTLVDQKAGNAIRWSVNTSGNVTISGSVTVGNNATITGSLTAASLTSTGSINASLDVNAGRNVSASNAVYISNLSPLYNSGGWLYYPGYFQVGNGVNIGGQMQSNTINCLSTCQVNGGLNVNGGTNLWSNAHVGGSLTIGGTGALYDGGGNQLVMNTNPHVLGSSQIDGNENVNGSFSANSITGNSVRSNGDLTCGGNCYASGNLSTPNHLTAGYGFCLGGAAMNFDYTLGFPIGNHAQWASGLGVYAQFFASYSDADHKQNAAEVERDALAAILPIKFYSYDSPRITPQGEVVDARSHIATGFLAQQLQESMPDAVVEVDQPVKFNPSHPETGEVLCGWDTRPALGVDMMTVIAYQMRAIQQLADRVKQLEAA